MRNARLGELQAGIKIGERNDNSLRYLDDTTLWAERAGLNLNIRKTKIKASGSITSWQIGGVKVEAVTNFLFLGSKIIVDGYCSHEIRRRLLLGRKAMTNLNSVL